MKKISALTALLAALACAPASDQPAEREPFSRHAGEPAVIDDRCRLPGDPRVVHEGGGAVLLVWEMPADPILQQAVLPPDAGFLAYREAVRADRADMRWPVADAADPESEAEAELWRDERFNGELARSGEVGSIDPIVCLDALFFAYQNRRVSQLERPTEFLASVLRRDGPGGPELVAVFGAGTDIFPPKAVYGFDVVDEYLADGWTYVYALHNHTLQRNRGRIALGTPTLSTSDVQLTRGLVAERGLERARVTNGFYTFSVGAAELERFRSR